MFRPLMLSPDLEQAIEHETTAALKKAGVTGAAAEKLHAEIVQRAYRHGETGELTIDVWHPHIADKDRSGWTEGEWLSGQPRPTPFADALKQIFDAKGPEVVLARRRVQARIEQWRSEWDGEVRHREHLVRNQEDNRKMRLREAWELLSRNDRALARLAHAKKGKPLTADDLQEAIAAELAAHQSEPPPEWVPPPPEVPRPKSFAETWPNLTCLPKPGHNNVGWLLPEDYEGRSNTRERGIGAAKLEITTSTIADADDEA